MTPQDLSTVRRVATTLDRLGLDSSRLGLSGPTLLLVGEIASLPAAGQVHHIDRASIAEPKQDVVHA